MHLKNLVYLVHVDSTNSPPSPLVDLRGLFMNPPSPLSSPHGLRMTPYGVIPTRKKYLIFSIYCTFSRIFELCNFWGALAKKGLDPKHLIYFSFSTPFFSQLMYPRIWGDNLDKKTMMVQLPMLSL